MAELVRNIVYYIISDPFLFYLKIVFLIVSFILFLAIIFLLIITNWINKFALEDFTEALTYRPYGAKKTFKQWSRIKKRMETGKASDFKMAIVDADALLKEILEKMGYKGETMRQILESIDSKVLPNIASVWEAHEIRNNIVHNPDYDISLEKARKMMQVYEQSFRDLEMF